MHCLELNFEPPTAELASVLSKCRPSAGELYHMRCEQHRPVAARLRRGIDHVDGLQGANKLYLPG